MNQFKLIIRKIRNFFFTVFTFSLLNLLVSIFTMKNMTNQVILSSGLYSSEKSNSSVYSSGNDTSNGVDFSSLLTNMLSTSSLLPGIDNSKSNMTDLSSLILMLISKLLSDSGSISSLLEADSPNGAPLVGTLTQGCHEGHVALDFGVVSGTNVHSTMSGKVVYAGWNTEGYGNLVIIENGDYQTYYAHLSSIPVKVGQTVDEGDIIGKSGNTGNSTGPHLHYEVRREGIAIDPTATLSDSK